MRATRRRASTRPSWRELDPGPANLLPRPQQVAPSSGDRSRALDLADRARGDPPQRLLAGDPDPLRPRALAEPVEHARGDMTAAERGDVGGLGAVQQVPAREQPRPRRPQARVDHRPAGSRIELGAREHRELVVGDPVGREHDRVAVDPSHPPGGELGQLDRLDARTAVDRGHGGPGQQGNAEARGRPSPEEGERLMARQLGRHRDGPGAAVLEREQSAENETCSAPTTTARDPTRSRAR